MLQGFFSNYLYLTWGINELLEKKHASGIVMWFREGVYVYVYIMASTSKW